MPQQVSFGQIIERHPRERNSGDLCARLLPAARFHGTFRVLEVHDHFELTDALELHVIELPKLGRKTDEPQLARWVRFFLAESEAELQELAMSDVDMQRARDSLDQLSQDPAARELARQRELARANLAIIRGYEREEGRQEGRAEGRQDGRAEGLRLAIESICDVLEIELIDDRRQALLQLDDSGLRQLLDSVRSGHA